MTRSTLRDVAESFDTWWTAVRKRRTFDKETYSQYLEYQEAIRKLSSAYIENNSLSEAYRYVLDAESAVKAAYKTETRIDEATSNRLEAAASLLQDAIIEERKRSGN